MPGEQVADAGVAVQGVVQGGQLAAGIAEQVANAELGQAGDQQVGGRGGQGGHLFYSYRKKRQKSASTPAVLPLSHHQLLPRRLRTARRRTG